MTIEDTLHNHRLAVWQHEERIRAAKDEVDRRESREILLHLSYLMWEQIRRLAVEEHDRLSRDDLNRSLPPIRYLDASEELVTKALKEANTRHPQLRKWLVENGDLIQEAFDYWKQRSRGNR